MAPRPLLIGTRGSPLALWQVRDVWARLIAAHGLAEMAQSKEFDELKQKLGGDEPFFRAVLDHLGMFSAKT